MTPARDPKQYLEGIWGSLGVSWGMIMQSAPPFPRRGNINIVDQSLIFSQKWST